MLNTAIPNATAPDERTGVLSALYPRFEPIVGDDAVQHVPQLQPSDEHTIPNASPTFARLKRASMERDLPVGLVDPQSCVLNRKVIYVALLPP